MCDDVIVSDSSHRIVLGLLYKRGQVVAYQGDFKVIQRERPCRL